jgi:hypothetical protein
VEAHTEEKKVPQNSKIKDDGFCLFEEDQEEAAQTVIVNITK